MRREGEGQGGGADTGAFAGYAASACGVHGAPPAAVVYSVEPCACAGVCGGAGRVRLAPCARARWWEWWWEWWERWEGGTTETDPTRAVRLDEHRLLASWPEANGWFIVLHADFRAGAASWCGTDGEASTCRTGTITRAE